MFEGASHCLGHPVELGGELSELRGAGCEDRRSGLPDGHLGHRALQPVDGSHHPSGEGAGSDDGQEQQGHAPGRDPGPRSGDVGRGSAPIHLRDHDRGDLAVLADVGPQQHRVRVPGQHPRPGLWRLVHQRTPDLGGDSFVGQAEACRGGHLFAVRVRNEDGFAVHERVARDDLVDGDPVVRIGGDRVAELDELCSPLVGELGGTPIRRAQCEGNGERADRQQQENDHHRADAASHSALQLEAEAADSLQGETVSQLSPQLGDEEVQGPGASKVGCAPDLERELLAADCLP